MTTETLPIAPQAPEEHAPGNRLGSFLCWAVVFADIGTSVYYTPGILYGLYGRLAGFFVILTLGVFILLTLKYAEVTQRFPEGGGVVTVTSHALSPWFGALGGMLILVDYFLTAALSSLSGITYFSFIVPQIGPAILGLTILAVFVLGVLNWWGIKESASVSAVIAVVAFISDIAILVVVAIHVPFATISRLFAEMFAGHQLTFQTLIAGYAGAFLAFSGLESISQLSPVMRVPRKKITGWALGFVVVTVGITSPLLTVFSTTLLCAHGQFENGLLTCVSAAGRSLEPAQFISLLGGAYGGPVLGIAVAISAAALLIFASNTAIIGSYHVFLALTRMQFFPPVLTHVNRLRGTPHWAILLATAIPIAVLLGARGQIDLLGDLYAFGLLGAFTLTCLGIDILRWRESPRRGIYRAAYTGPSKAHDDAELAAQNVADAHTPPSRLARWLEPLELPRYAARFSASATRVRAVVAGWALWLTHAAYRRPVADALRPWWGPIGYGVGVLTTILVGLAWGVNLVNKIPATIFGGGVTLLGLAVAFGYQVYRELNGEPTVHPLPNPAHFKHAWLVILPTAANAGHARRTLVRSVAAAAGSHTLIFAYLDPSLRRYTVSSMLEIADPWARNPLAQKVLSKALVTAWRAGVPRHQMHFYFATGGQAQVTDIWRSFRPDETIALAGQGVGRQVQVEYMRTKDVDGTRLAFYGHHPLAPAARGADQPGETAAETTVVRLLEPAIAWFRRQRVRLDRWLASRSAEREAARAADQGAVAPGASGVHAAPPPTSAEPARATSAGSAAEPAPGMPGGETLVKVVPTNGRTNRTPPPVATRPGTAVAGAGRETPSGTVPAQSPETPASSSSAANGTGEPAKAGAGGDRSARPGVPTDPLNLVPSRAMEEAEQYVWTGTELKRRDELPGATSVSPALAPASTPEPAAGESPEDAAAQPDAPVVPVSPEASAELDVEHDAEPEALPTPDDQS